MELDHYQIYNSLAVGPLQPLPQQTVSVEIHFTNRNISCWVIRCLLLQSPAHIFNHDLQLLCVFSIWNSCEIGMCRGEKRGWYQVFVCDVTVLIDSGQGSGVTRL